MQKWECLGCGWVYIPERGDEDGGIAPGTAYEDLAEDWECPACGAPKSYFQKID